MQIEAEIAKAKTRICELEKAMKASESFEATLSCKREMSDAEGALALLQTRLSEARQRETEDLTEMRLGEARQKLADSEAEHADCLEGEAFIIEELARRLEDAAEQTTPLVNRADQLRNKHPYLLHEATGEWPDEVMTALPMSAPPTSRSRLYEVAALAVRIARDTETRGPLAIDLVWAYISAAEKVQREARQRTLELARSRPVATGETPVQISEHNLTAGQIIALRRGRIYRN
jgi:hypothetical protein